jgi:nucleoside-diphosphate-sugar epimerase
MAFAYDNAFRGSPPVRALITGGAGFIGSHLARKLLQLGAEVVVLDDLSGGSRDNVPSQARFTEASILDDDRLREAASGCRYVFHEAAVVSVPESVGDPQRCAAINILGTERVLEAARDAGVQRLIFAASAAAYGGAPRLPSREDDPADCRSPYAASKVAGEALLAAFGHCYPLSTISLRYFNVFGPGQNANSAYAAAISAFHKALREGGQPTIHGDGLQTRDFVFIDNIVHANLLAATSPRAFRGEVINIGTGERVNLLEVLEHMGRAMNVKVQPQFAQPRVGDVRDSVADIARARELLGYDPLIDFAEGMRRMLRTVASVVHEG